MKRVAFALAISSAALLLGACNGSVTSVSLPAASPWDNFQTIVASPHDDLTVATVGSDLAATISNPEQFAVCSSDQGGFFAFCGSSVGCAPDGPEAECAAQAPAGATNVAFTGQLPFAYGVGVTLNRPAFNAGGVQIQSTTAGTLGAIAMNINGGTTLNIGVGFSEGLISGPNTGSGGSGPFPIPSEYLDDFSLILLSPNWEDFGDGYVCTDGTTTSCDPDVSPEGVAAVCLNDGLALRTNESTGPVTVLCGDVTVNTNVNPDFDSVGQCISTLKQQQCSGLTGKAKAACNHAQIGVCHATFNVPSAHNPS